MKTSHPSHQEFLECAGHIALARLELDYALGSFAEGEHERAKVELFEALASVFRALGYDSIDAYINHRAAPK